MNEIGRRPIRASGLPSPRPRSWASWFAPSTTWPPIWNKAGGWRKPRPASYPRPISRWSRAARSWKPSSKPSPAASSHWTPSARSSRPIALFSISSRPTSHESRRRPAQIVFAPEVAAELSFLERRAQRMGIASTEFEMPSSPRVLSLTATISALDLGTEARLDSGHRRRHGISPRPAPARVEGSRAARCPRNQESPYAYCVVRRAHPPPHGPQSPRIARRDPPLRRRDPLFRGIDEHARRSVCRPRRVPRSAAKTDRSERHRRERRNAVPGAASQHSHRTAPRSRSSAGDGRSQALKRALANLIDNAAEAMENSLLRVLSIETCSAKIMAWRNWCSPIPVTASPMKCVSGCSFPTSPPNSAEPDWALPSPQRSFRSTTVRFAPRITRRPERASFSSCRWRKATAQTARDSRVAVQRQQARRMNHILIVDDEAEIRESLEEILSEEGYAVSSTASGSEAMRSGARRALRCVAARYLAARSRWSRRARTIRSRSKWKTSLKSSSSPATRPSKRR